MAPIIVKEYEWTQNIETITVTVPLRGVSRKDIDIFTYATYIKVNAPPFLFELFLYSEINEERSKCLFTTDSIIFELSKLDQTEWPTLTAEISNKEKVGVREMCIEKKHQQIAKEKKAKSEKHAEIKQFAIQKQIGLGTSQKSKIEDLKKVEKDKVDRELMVIKERGILERKSTDLKESKTAKDSGARVGLEGPKNKEIIKNNSATTSAYKFPIPLPRQNGRIQVTFTERHFPTPTRESKLEEEQEWLKKQFEARKAAGFVAEDLRPEELNPVWLKDKGDSFYSHDNFLGAVSAYSHAINIGSKMPELYVNRSAAHYRLGNLHKALQDCSVALELLTPHVPRNEEDRFTCHARRASILCRLGVPDKAISEYEEALKLRPEDLKLLKEFEKAKKIVDEMIDDSD